MCRPTLPPQEIFPLLISVSGQVDPRTDNQVLQITKHVKEFDVCETVHH